MGQGCLEGEDGECLCEAGQVEGAWCLVTVGSTQFGQLCAAALSAEVGAALRQLGCRAVLLQAGASDLPLHAPTPGHYRLHQLHYHIFRYRGSLSQEMGGARVVVTHGGAGSCMEALRVQGQGGRVQVVVVEQVALQGGHQGELARRLHSARLVQCAPPDPTALSHALLQCNLQDPDKGSVPALPDAAPARRALAAHLRAAFTTRTRAPAPPPADRY